MTDATGPATPSAMSASPDRTLAILAHLGGLFTSWIVPLAIYLIKRGDPDAAFTSAQAREALNFQITIFIASIVCFILSFVLIGILLFWIVMLADLVLSIRAAVRSSAGTDYRYPLTLRLVG